MKKLCILFLMALCVVQASAYKKSNVTIKVNGKNRDVVVFVPNTFSDNCPLMIVTHGMNQSPEYQYDSDKMYELIDKEKFVVAYPRSDGNTWDIGGTNDQDFIVKTIDKMYELYKICKARVYWSGFSMGSMLIYHCMPNMQDKIAAFAPTSGIQFSEQPWTKLKKPVNLIQCHAYGDDVFGYQQYGIRDYVMHFKDYNKCKDYKKTSGYRVNGSWFDGDKEVWSNGKDGSEVELFSYNGGGHWPMNENRHEIWNFCKRFSLVSGPAVQAVAPEHNSFDMDVDKHRTFVVTFDKAADCSKAKATLTRGSQSIALSLAEEGESNVLTFTVPESQTLAAGAYKLNVTNISSTDGGKSGDIEATYTYGIEEVGATLVLDTLLVQDWYAQRETIGEGIPDGWKRVNTKSGGRDEKGQNEADVTGCRMKYFLPEGEMAAGFYLSARDYDRADFTYGSYAGKTLILRKGKYLLTFNSTYWTLGAKNSSSTFDVSFVNSANGTEIFTTSVASAGCVNEKAGVAVENCAHHVIECDLPINSKCLLRFSYSDGWNGVVIGEPLLTTAPSVAERYKGEFLRTMAKAKDMLAALKAMESDQHADQTESLAAAIALHDGLFTISPSEYEAATAALASAMQPLAEVVGVEAVEAGSVGTAAATYDLSGRRIEGTPRRGIAIVRMGDGTVRKVISLPR